MKVVALVSGGKDSCYAMMRCIDYGHEIVALANLLPEEDSVDELDSYMYQTVGHQIVERYAECMGLPLFRRRIKGSSRHKDLRYKVTFNDEVEDMYILLKEVKHQIPSVTAVSSGAIASDYQRLRVESVCSRLGLISLAYLWKKDQRLLLEEMVERGIIAILIKVAAMGLNPTKHLGREISDMQTELLSLNESYGINVCGEGGEYESLTLDCPLFRDITWWAEADSLDTNFLKLFKEDGGSGNVVIALFRAVRIVFSNRNARIILDNFQIVLHSADTIAPVGILHPTSFHLERKKATNSVSSSCGSDEIGMDRKCVVYDVQGSCFSDHVLKPHFENSTPTRKDKILQTSTTKGNIFSLGCWMLGSSSEDLQADLTTALMNIESCLCANGLGWENVLYVHLYISDMRKFNLANDVYLRFITESKCSFGVPSRSTVELPLVEAGLGNAYVEVLVATGHDKNVLHVQSISSWAPSCIGPYSQATLDKGILYMAGQLGLDPPTMLLTSGGPTAELKKALENCEAVANCFNCSIASSVILFVIYCSASLTTSEKKDVQDGKYIFLSQKTLNAENDGKLNIPNHLSLYILAPDLPKRARVEVKPVLYVPSPGDDDEASMFPPVGIKSPNSSNLAGLCLSGSFCQKFVISGKICAATVSVTSDMVSEMCCATNLNAADVCYGNSEEHMRRISRFCVQNIYGIILENQFDWNDMVSLRIYFATSFCSRADMLNSAFSEAFKELAETSNYTAEHEPIFCLVPVLSAGTTSAMGDLLTCEIFASKL